MTRGRRKPRSLRALTALVAALAVGLGLGLQAARRARRARDARGRAARWAVFEQAARRRASVREEFLSKSPTWAPVYPGGPVDVRGTVRLVALRGQVRVCSDARVRWENAAARPWEAVAPDPPEARAFGVRPEGETDFICGSLQGLTRESLRRP